MKKSLSVCMSFAALVFVLFVSLSSVSEAATVKPVCRSFSATPAEIHKGDTVTLTWDTANGTRLSITPKVFSTQNVTGVQKGTLSVLPTKDTTYTLTVSRGNEKDTCTAEVKVVASTPIVAFSTREQVPAAVAVSQIPYTGFDGSGFLTFFFFSILAAWIAAAWYVVVVLRHPLLGYSLPSQSLAHPSVQKGTHLSVLPHSEYQNITNGTLYQSSSVTPNSTPMKNILARISKEKMKYASIALALVAVAVFVILPLMPQVHSSVVHFGLKVGISAADDGGDGGGGGGDGGGGDAGGGDAGTSDSPASTGPDSGAGTTGTGCCDTGAPADTGGTTDAGGGGGDVVVVTVPVDICPNIAGNQDIVPAGMSIDAGGNCVLPPVDVCPNIAGAQTTVPGGMIVDAGGNCVVPPPTDVCPNIDGAQAAVPAGMIKDGAGNCVTPPTIDVCPNIAGDQATIPAGMIKDGAGNCVTPPTIDVCPNIAGDQATIPAGMIKDGAGNCVTPPTIDVCPNIAGDQATIPAGMIKDGAGNCVTPPVTIPVCDSLTVSPATISAAGTVSLAWHTTNADSVTIDNSIGAVAVTGTTSKAVPAADTTFILTAVKGAESRTCQAVVHYTPVVTPKLSCDSFAISPNSVDSGYTTTMTWATSNADSVSIDGGIGTVGAGGSRSITVTKDQTYTLTAVRGSDSVTCTASANVATHGGGGGGGPSLRCSLFEVSSTSILPGESTTLHWRTVGGSKVMIDNDALATTTGSQVKDGSVKVSPSANTKYKLTVSNGSRKAACYIDVHVGGVTAISNRDQQPVTSIAFTNIPYTGFEAGPTLTSIFYILLTLWSLGIAYVVVIKRGTVFGLSLAGHAMVAGTGMLVPQKEMHVAQVDSHEVAHAVLPTVATIERGAPSNLPIASMSVAYASSVHATEHVDYAVHTEGETDLVSRLETYAHGHNVLLSSDALRAVIDYAHTEEASLALLTDIVNRAKAAFAREDGWVVLNRERVMSLFSAGAVAAHDEHAHAETPVHTHEERGAHTLAEAILTGNTALAYTFLGENAIEVIADTAESLDSVIRARKGAGVAPDMLLRTAEGLSDEKIHAAIVALVTAIDGTYADQTASVRLAVIKALKAVA